MKAKGKPETIWSRKGPGFRYWKRLFHRLHPAWPPLAAQIAAKRLDTMLDARKKPTPKSNPRGQ